MIIHNTDKNQYFTKNMLLKDLLRQSLKNKIR